MMTNCMPLLVIDLLNRRVLIRDYAEHWHIKHNKISQTVEAYVDKGSLGTSYLYPRKHTFLQTALKH